MGQRTQRDADQLASATLYQQRTVGDNVGQTNEADGMRAQHRRRQSSQMIAHPQQGGTQGHTIRLHGAQGARCAADRSQAKITR